MFFLINLERPARDSPLRFGSDLTTYYDTDTIDVLENFVAYAEY